MMRPLNLADHLLLSVTSQSECICGQTSCMIDLVLSIIKQRSGQSSVKSPSGVAFEHLKASNESFQFFSVPPAPLEINWALVGDRWSGHKIVSHPIPSIRPKFIITHRFP
ncbi:hypothetical protein XENOCAPTIV_021481 [Xenoophorus captivus]|uniref:Uncharacterized protein n=1 Tax=Xenoophorus captivus TaxID=1517983 RepID=A0ABV0R1L9_9TELE